MSTNETERTEQKEQKVGGMRLVGDAQTVIQELSEAAAARHETMRVRLQPNLFDHKRQAYVGLPKVSWVLELPDGPAVEALVEGLTLYWRLMAELGGAQAMKDYLEQCAVAIRDGDAARD